MTRKAFTLVELLVVVAIIAALVALVTGPDGGPNDFAYFWMTGLLSSFLDNAPTYLVFFELAGGDAQLLADLGNGS